MKQALEGEYPKLLKLQNEVINRLNQLQPGFSDIEMDNVNEDLNHSEEIIEKQKLDLLRVFEDIKKKFRFLSGQMYN